MVTLHDHGTLIMKRRRRATSRWRRLRDRISKGTLTGRVPSAATIAQQYEVAKGTAERALAILREEGLIRSVMGRGHFVVPPAERG